MNIEITKKQIEENEAITLTLNKYINCSSCNGHKTESGHPPRRCYECGGSGLDSYIMDRPCTSCSGKGVILKFPCKYIYIYIIYIYIYILGNVEEKE